MQHDEDVKRAFKVFQEKNNSGEGMTEDELRKIMDPDQKMKEMDFKVKRYLYMKYPRPLTKKEKEEAQEMQERDELEAYFLSTFGETEQKNDE